MISFFGTYPRPIFGWINATFLQLIYFFEAEQRDMLEKGKTREEREQSRDDSELLMQQNKRPEPLNHNFADPYIFQHLLRATIFL